jgi:hypothetical protein
MAVKVDINRLKPYVPSTVTFKTLNKTIVSLNNINRLVCKIETWHVVFKVGTELCAVLMNLSRQLFTTESRFRCRASPCDGGGGRNDTWTGFSLISSFL